MSENSPNLQKVFEFAKLLTKFRQVERILLTNDTDRYENDVEHSYMLVMLADYIISLENLTLDRDKVRRYALVHDLVEVYAGDTYIYSTDQKLHDTKHEREADALKKLMTEFPEHTEVWRDIQSFEKKEDEEAKFVYALDKVQPVIQIYLDGGKTWKKEVIHLHQLTDHKDEKVKVSPIIDKYWKELVSILERNKNTLFPK